MAGSRRAALRDNLVSRCYRPDRENRPMRYLVTIALVLMLALPVTAQDFHKSWAAYQRGDSATALRAWRQP